VNPYDRYPPGTRSLERKQKLELAVAALLHRGALDGRAYRGMQSRLAEHFGVSRQRVHQVVCDLRARASAS
jgi:hypothetical protein